MSNGRKPGGVAFRAQPETYSSFYPTPKRPRGAWLAATLAFLVTVSGGFFAAVGLLASACWIAGAC